jgi:uncharacterized protein involved in exopolysaccharide biosynthesis
MVMENNNKETVELKTIIVKYLHHWKLFLTVFIISFIPAIIYLSIYPRTYEFASAIQIQTDDKSSLPSFGLGEAAGLMKSFGIGGGSGSVSIDDEMTILTSNRLLRQVILDLGMNVSYSKPFSLYKMYDDSPLRLTADSSTMANLEQELKFKITVSQGSINIKGGSKTTTINETASSLPAKIRIGKDEFTLDFTNNEDSQKSFKLDIRCSPASWSAEYWGKKITFEDISKSSNVLLITSSDHSRKRGKDFLTGLIAEYNKDTKENNDNEENRTLSFVNGRIAEVLSDLDNVELEIQAYKTINDMTMIDTDIKMYAEALKELQSTIIETEAQSRLIDMLDDYIKKPENKYSVMPMIMTATDGEKGGLISDYNEVIIERENLLRHSNETNPAFKEADKRVDMLRGGVTAMIGNSKKSYEKTLDNLRAQERQILSKRKSVPEKEYEYLNYRRNQEILQGIYLLLLQKREEAALSIGNKSERARIIEPAFIKKKPLGPRKLYAVIGIMVLSLIIPIGILLTKELITSIKEEYNKE